MPPVIEAVTPLMGQNPKTLVVYGITVSFEYRAVMYLILIPRIHPRLNDRREGGRSSLYGIREPARARPAARRNEALA